MATRATYRNRINNIIRENTNGLFNDDFWTPVHTTFKKLAEAGYEVDLVTATYTHDENGTPDRKVWTFQIPFGTKKPFYGLITAAGAGTVKDPLSKYDVTGYVS